MVGTTTMGWGNASATRDITETEWMIFRRRLISQGAWITEGRSGCGNRESRRGCSRNSSCYKTWLQLFIPYDHRTPSSDSPRVYPCRDHAGSRDHCSAGCDSHPKLDPGTQTLPSH